MAHANRPRFFFRRNVLLRLQALSDIYVTKVGTHLAGYSVSQYAEHSRGRNLTVLLLKMTSCDITTHTANYTKPVFDSSLISVGFWWSKWPEAGLFFEKKDLLRFSPVSVILTLLHTRLSFMHHRSYIILATIASLNKIFDLCFLTIYQ